MSVYTFLSVYTWSCAQLIIQHWKTKTIISNTCVRGRIHPCVSVYMYLVICANNPALEDQNHYNEYLRAYAEYTHVSMRYLLICANNPALEDQNHYNEYLRAYADYTHVSMRYLLICANNPALDDQNHYRNICVRTQNTSVPL